MKKGLVPLIDDHEKSIFIQLNIGFMWAAPKQPFLGLQTNSSPDPAHPIPVVK